MTYKRQPRDQISAAVPKGYPLRISGAQKPNVPAGVRFSCALSTVSANPKSTNLAVKSDFLEDSITFSSFRSLWMIPYLWRYLRARPICFVIVRAKLMSRGSKLPASMICWRSPPCMSSMTMYYLLWKTNFSLKLATYMEFLHRECSSSSLCTLSFK